MELLVRVVPRCLFSVVWPTALLIYHLCVYWGERGGGPRTPRALGGLLTRSEGVPICLMPGLVFTQ